MLKPEQIAAAFARLKRRRPRVHALTNWAAMELTANMLLAAGAVPSLTFAPAQIEGFVRGADALLINMGTWDEARAAAAPLAVKVAAGRGLNWVLDPVMVDRSPERRNEALALAEHRPAIIRGNRAEIASLFAVADHDDAFAAVARERALVLAVTGAEDMVTDGKRMVHLGNGHALMDAVTAMGCAGTALIAALCAQERDAFLAAVAGLSVLGVAGEMAGDSAQGPGSFVVHLLDCLYNLSPEGVRERLRMV